MRSGLVVLLVAACGDNHPPRATVAAPGAVWIAHRPALDAPWTRTDGVAVEFDVDGGGAPYEVAVLCRGDIGDGWSLTASYDDGVVWEHVCSLPQPPPDQSVQVTVDWRGPPSRLDAVWIGPGFFGTTGRLRPGIYDVIATAGDAGLVPRVEILRGVAIESDHTITVDLAAHGLDMIPTVIRIDGEEQRTGLAALRSAGGTHAVLPWDPQARTTTYVVPDHLRGSGDEQTVRVSTVERKWARLPIDEFGLDETLPGPAPDVTFSWDEAPTAAWPLDPSYRARLWIVGAADTDNPIHHWTHEVYPVAQAALATNGVVTLRMTASTVDGWNPSWWPSGVYAWNHRLTRDRADGGEDGFAAGARLTR